MPKARRTWVYSPPKPPAPKAPAGVKARAHDQAQQLIETVLKPQHIKPPPDDSRFNYLVTIFTKTSGSCSITVYRVTNAFNTSRTIRSSTHKTGPMETARMTFQPGDEVIWWKRIPGGDYVYPVRATVLATTAKRVKIAADDVGAVIIRHVPLESLQHRELG